MWALLLARRPAHLLPWGACTALFTTLLYLPVLMVNRLDTMASNRFFAHSGRFGAASLKHFSETLHALAAGVPATLLFALAILTVVGLLDAWRERRRPLLLLLPAVLAGAGLVYVAKQSIPFPRTWMFLVPLLLIVADAGWSRLAGKRRWPALGLVLAASLFAWHIARSGAIERIPDMGPEPRAREMAGELSMRSRGTDWLCAKPPADALLRFYLQQDFPLGMGPPSAAQVFYVGLPPALPAQRVALVEGLGLYRLASAPRPGFAVGRNCWLRGGHFFG
jgi:hypothetical protein